MIRPASLIVVLATAVLLVGGAAIIAVGRVTDSTPQSSAPTMNASRETTRTPAPASADRPRQALRSALPTVSDLAVDQDDYTVDFSYDSAGPDARPARCVDPQQIRGLEAAATVRRDFSDGIGEARIAAWVLEFDRTREARAAAEEVERLIRRCLDSHRKPNGPYEIDGAAARYGLALTAVDRGGQNGIWETLGYTTVGDRLAVLDLTVRSPEYLVVHSEQAARQTGLPLHPMIETLPAVADRLRS